MAPSKDADLSTAVDRLSDVVEKLSDRVEKIEQVMESVRDMMSKGKGFLAGALAVILIAIFGVLGAAKQLRDWFS